MYSKHFQLTDQPFGLTPNTNFYCNLSTHENALNTLFYGLKSGEGFITVTGEVGTGKTLLCRKLLNALDEPFITAYLPNPDLTPIMLKKALLKELGVDTKTLNDLSIINDTINETLLQLHQNGKKIVLIIDESQALPNDTLESVRLLTNLETESEKLLQIVLFGQPELNDRLNEHHFRQLKQRITFSYELAPLSKSDTEAYIFHRLNIAGYNRGRLFSKRSVSMLHKKSKGTPRLINIYCHKAMLSAYGKGKSTVSKKDMFYAIKDSDPKSTGTGRFQSSVLMPALFVIASIVLFICYQHHIGKL